jgi:hypothetical protein
MTRKMLAAVSVLLFVAVQAIAQSAAPLVLDDGTPIRLRTTRTISSAEANVDDRVDFEVVDDIKVGDTIVIKHGTAAIGTVTEAKSKGRMGKGGKLNVNIDFTRTVTGDKVALRGTKDVKGGGHAGAMTGAMVGTAIVFWPAAPLFLFMHGKDITVPKGHEFNVYTSGAVTLDAAKLWAPANGTPAPSSASAVLAVNSTPGGAEIEVDGNFVGSTPSSVPVSMGSHNISVKKNGYASWQRTIHVTGGTVNVMAELARPLRASAGTK